jgi:hypothetical protein
MKTNFELPDTLMQRARVTAARRGLTLTSFVKSALEFKLTRDECSSVEKPWMRFAGVFADKEGSRRLMRAVEEACEQIDPETWR